MSDDERKIRSGVETIIESWRNRGFLGQFTGIECELFINSLVSCILQDGSIKRAVRRDIIAMIQSWEERGLMARFSDRRRPMIIEAIVDYIYPFLELGRK